MARVLLGVTGGIAAYRALELARLATKAGHSLRVLMTPAATRFVGPPSFDGMVPTAFLACPAPRLVAPAMNDRMYKDAATQANVATLRERGVTVIEPDVGPLASRREHGVGRLPAPERLLAEIEAALPGPHGPWDGLRVLVTAGGTREPIDPVRFIGNRSSGRMGIALATAAARRGGEVTLIAANVSLPLPGGVRAIEVETTEELEAAVAAEFPSAAVLLMAAAPADF